MPTKFFLLCAANQTNNREELGFKCITDLDTAPYTPIEFPRTCFSGSRTIHIGTIILGRKEAAFFPAPQLCIPDQVQYSETLDTSFEIPELYPLLH